MRPRRRRLARIALVAGALFLAVGVNGGAAAQTAPSGDFAFFQVTAAGEGISFTYDSPGLIPGTPTPLAQVSLPEALSTFDFGPSGYALASVAYPGPVLSDLPTLLRLAGYDTPVPAYPIRTQTYYPSGPFEADQTIGGAQMQSRVRETGSEAFAAFTAAQLPGMLNIESITAQTDTHIEDGQVVSRVRVVLSGVDLVAGLIHMDSIVTDLVSTSNSVDSASEGSTVASGVTVLGLPATLDAEGLHFTAPPSSPTTTEPSPLAPVLDPLGLGTVAEPLQPVATALSELLTSTVGTANAGLNELLAASGISVRLVDPVESKDGASVARTAFGVLVTLHYDGQTTPVMSQLLGLVPVQDLPSQGVGPIPFTSPQSLVLALQATHVETVGLATGTVRATADPPYAAPARPSSPLTPVLPSSGGGPSLTPSGFSTATPSLGTGSSGGGSIGGALPIGFAGPAPLAPALAALFLVTTGAFAWALSGRLADNVLSAASSTCPEGLDRRPRGGS